MFALLPAALFLMLLFLMMQLHSFGRVALVVATVPLGLIGIVLALIISNRPLGFVAILGILALVGMIARNAVILIDQIETERAEGRDIWDAVVEATLSRFRPIMLTAISTVLGLIPIAPTVFWGPMAFAIMGGLFVATMLTLLVLPVFYITLYRAKQPAATAALANAPLTERKAAVLGIVIARLHHRPRRSPMRFALSHEDSVGDARRRATLPPAAGTAQGISRHGTPYLRKDRKLSASSTCADSRLEHLRRNRIRLSILI